MEGAFEVPRELGWVFVAQFVSGFLDAESGLEFGDGVENPESARPELGRGVSLFGEHSLQVSEGDVEFNGHGPGAIAALAAKRFPVAEATECGIHSFCYNLLGCAVLLPQAFEARQGGNGRWREPSYDFVGGRWRGRIGGGGCRGRVGWARWGLRVGDGGSTVWRLGRGACPCVCGSSPSARGSCQR